MLGVLGVSESWESWESQSLGSLGISNHELYLCQNLIQNTLTYIFVIFIFFNKGPERNHIFRVFRMAKMAKNRLKIPLRV